MGEYEVFADDDLELVRAIVRGDVHKSLGRKIITEARTLAAEKGYGILCDVRKALCGLHWSSGSTCQGS